MSFDAIPALTLRNPWAHLIAHCGKNIENRGWKPPAHVTRILIHAGAGWDESLIGDEWQDTFERVDTSAIVAVATITEVCGDSRNADTLRCRCGGWAMAGQFHWRLANVVALSEPVPAKGRQGLWRPDDGVMSTVPERLLAVAS